MKKIFFSLLAIAAIASCAKTEAVYEAGDVEIKLSPVTALQTKAQVLRAIDGTTYPTGENFDVFAYWSKNDNGMFTDGELFLKSLEDNGGAEFTNRGNYWGGEVKYYWPKNGYLRFAAYSPADLMVEHNQVGDVYSIKPYVQPEYTNATWDFLVAKTSPAYSVMTATEKVAVEFEHALSWITLKVIAKDADAAKAFDIKKVTIKDVYTSADFEATMLNGMVVDHNDPAYPWTNWGGEKDYVVFQGSQMVTETLTDIENTPAGTVVIPQATTRVVVEFDQYGVNGTADTPGMTVELDLVLDTDDTPWVPGKHYNYNLIFGLDEILINPSVVDWDEVNVGDLEAGVINVSTAAQLEAALTKSGNVKIVFQNDIAGDFTAVEEAGRTLTIDGNDYKLTGSFFLNGKSTYAKASTVFENIHFETADASAMTGAAFIYCGEEKGTNYRYPDGISVKNCTFTATGSAVDNAVAIKLWSLKGALSVEDCYAEGLHSLMQLTSCGEAVVNVFGTKVVNCKNGISLGNTGNTTIRESKIAAREYGVRANGSVATTEVVDSEIEAKQPIIVRNVTTDGYVLNVDDQTTLTAGNFYQVIFTAKSDDVDYVVPTASFTYNGPMTLNVFPVTSAGKPVATDTELREALKNGQNVTLTEDITTTDAESNGNGATGINISGGVFDGNGHTIEVEGATGTWDSAIAIKGGTIKNVTVAKGFRGIFFKKGTEKIVLENVIINGPTYTISCDSASNQGFEAYNSKFYGWTSYAGTIGTGYFEGCTFGAGAGYNFSRPYAPTTYVNCAFEAGHKIDARAKVSFENCTLDGVALTAANINTLVTGNRQNIESVK